jgi:hypothetical protein
MDVRPVRLGACRARRRNRNRPNQFATKRSNP